MKTTFSTEREFKDFVNQHFENESECFNEFELSTHVGVNSASESALEANVDNIRVWRKKIISLLHQVFFYFPSAFLLWMGSMAATYHIVVQSGYSLVTPAFLASYLSVFGVVFGIGNLKKLRDYLAPASIALFGMLIGLATGISPSLHLFLVGDVNFLYLFPVALMLPFIVKLWIESVEG